MLISKNTFWKDNLSGRIVEVLGFEEFYEDSDFWRSLADKPSGVLFKYVDNGQTEFLGPELFTGNYSMYKSSLNRLDWLGERIG